MLAVPREGYDTMVAHAIAGASEEVCGHFGGRFGERESRVRAVERATDAERATWPDRAHLIIALHGEHPVVGAWRWNGEADRFVREVLTVE